MQSYMLSNCQPNNDAIFSSDFECGNLLYAIQIAEREFDLIVSPDPFQVYSQWFYFKIQNLRKGESIKFNVLNCTKATTLYKCGMKPMMFSEKENELNGADWHYIPEEASYMKTVYESNYWYRKNGIEQYLNNSKHYTLSFTHTPEYDNDSIFFSMLRPYSFSRLYEFLYDTENILKEQAIVDDDYTKESLYYYKTPNVTYSRDILCFSKGGLPIDIIKISETNCKSTKKIIFVISRVHPCETPGSYKVEQLIRALAKQNPILKYYTFIIVPMINPDGVVCGNTRTDLNGNDLNRCWDNPDKEKCEQIYKIKSYIK
jgi:hypothetical protein